jgi:hypothetical protein
MKHFVTTTFLMAAAMAPLLPAQSWEVGAGAGGSFFTSQSVQSAGVSGNTGFQNAFALSAWLGHSTASMFAGELRYDYENAGLRLSSGGTSASFAGHTNAMHYDFIMNLTSSEASVRPFLAVGAGVKLYTGSGAETSVQPLQNLAFLTQTNQIEPVISIGGGVKFNLSRNAQLRLDLHDYLSPFPQNVIAPAPGAKIGGWVQDFSVMAGLSFALGN